MFFALQQFGPCIKHKLLTALDRISEQPEMELFDGVRLVKDPTLNDVRSGRSSDSTAANSATTPEDENAAGLDELVVNRIVDFFKSRSLQFKLLDNEPRLMADGKHPVILIFYFQFDMYVCSFIMNL